MASPFASITKLANTRVLVIGGTSGIGFAVAAAALEHGASVIVASSQAYNVDSATARLRERYPAGYSGRIAGFVCDLANQDTVEGNVVGLLERATRPGALSSGKGNGDDEEGQRVRLDHIVFTAGDISSGEETLNPNLSTLTIPALQQTSTVRYIAPLFIAKHISSYINISPSSSITLTSGTNTAKPQKGWTVLAAVGASVEAASRSLAVDLAPIRVNTVSPGAVMTELVGKVMGGAKQVDEFARKMGEGTLVGRVGRPEDVAEAYVYCMKDGFVDGVVLGSDGGRMMK